VAALRRALVYPLYRSWPLARRVALDVADVLALGKRATLKTLLTARKALAWSDAHHALNRLYLDDYCAWLQTVPRSRLARLAEHVRTTAASLTLRDLDLPLDWEDAELRGYGDAELEHDAETAALLAASAAASATDTTTSTLQ